MVLFILALADQNYVVVMETNLCLTLFVMQFICVLIICYMDLRLLFTTENN